MNVDMPYRGTCRNRKLCPTGPLLIYALSGHNAAVDLGNNIAALRKARGLSQTQLAERIGTTLNMMGKLERGGRDLTSKWITRLSEALGVEPSDLIAASTVAPTAPDVPVARYASTDDDTVEITQLDLSLSMGPGTVIDDYVEGQAIKFDIGFLRAITRSEFGRLRLVKGVGDSMYPTLNGGDVIMIDTTQRGLSRQDGIYWVSIYGAAGIKRLRSVGPKRILVVSDNPSVENYEVDANDVRIEGRAIWFARDL